MRNRASTPLSKAKVRQSWSKYNLYNLSRIITPPYKTRTFFQQKWTAKSLLRDYHGEQVREGQWERMFSRRLRSVIPMNPEYLAENDGSLESAGRGSGVEKERSRQKPQSIPYMQMTFAPLERRLDTAIFRAMFASSARQARQFVVHGAVTVNGKKMRFPGYLLNPGDMFQVDPERVMFATGAAKASAQNTSVKEGEDGVGEDDSAEKQQVETESTAEDEIDIDRDPREILKDLLTQSKSILASPRDKIGAKRKQDLRAFSNAVKRMLSKSKSSTILTDSLEAQFAELKNQLRIQLENKKNSKAALPSEQETGLDEKSQTKESEEPVSPKENAGSNYVSDKEYNELYDALATMIENPIDDSKPYATPWMPREYMSAFAFIPRYLEVNQNICAAVYLRHPVARPGLAEIPTPFGESTNASAFAWYLRRR